MLGWRLKQRPICCLATPPYPHSRTWLVHTLVLVYATHMSQAASRDLHKSALCVCGGLHSMPFEGALVRLRRVSERLDAEVFAVIWHSSGRKSNPMAVSDTVVLPGLAGWITQIAFAFRGSRGRASLRADYARGNPGNRSGDLLEEYERDLPGNYLQPLLHSSTGLFRNVAYALQDLWKCFGLIRGAELVRGSPFAYWGFVRFDMFWTAMPPPISYFESVHPTAIWIPDGMDFAGLNDRFALVPRRWADVYFGRWPRLMNGSLMEILREAASDPMKHGPWKARRVITNISPEWLLHAVLKLKGVPVARFASVGALLCSGDRERLGACTDALLPTTPSFKYIAEAREAILNAHLLARGWVWRYLETGPALKPPCFETSDRQAHCCTRRAGIGGNSSCWWDIYNFERCCPGARSSGIWVLPTQKEARERLDVDRADEMCWNLADMDWEPANEWKLQGFILEPVQMCVNLSGIAAAASGKLPVKLRSVPGIRGGVFYPMARDFDFYEKRGEQYHRCAQIGGQVRCDARAVTIAVLRDMGIVPVVAAPLKR